MLECTFDMQEAVVIDNGSHTIKMGFSGENTPREVIHSLEYVVQDFGGNDDASEDHLTIRNEFVGNEAWSHHKDEGYVYLPIKKGTIKNRDVLEEMWYGGMKSMKITELDGASILLTTPVLESRKNKEWMAEIFFEKYRCKSLALVKPPILSLFSTGNSTGLILEMGHGTTTAMPVFEGYSLSYATSVSLIAGEDVSYNLKKHVNSITAINLSCYENLRLIEDIKHSICSVIDEDLLNQKGGNNNIPFEEWSYELPDGNLLQLDKLCRYGPGEVYFENEKKVSKSFESRPIFMEIPCRRDLPTTLFAAAFATDPDIQQEITKKVIISGGGALLQGVDRRLRKHLDSKDIPDSLKMKLSSENRWKFSSWVGGSMLASLSTLEYFSIPRYQYEEGNSELQNLISRNSFG